MCTLFFEPCGIKFVHKKDLRTACFELIYNLVEYLSHHIGKEFMQICLIQQATCYKETLLYSNKET